MNPYASFLGNRNPREVIAATPQRLLHLFQAMGTGGAERSPEPGKWNTREILCHLADCEVVFAFRLRQTLAERNPVVQPFNQEFWAANYGAYDAQTALAAFTAARRWNLALIDSLPAEAFSRKLTHPERGEMTFQVVVETMGGHDLNHIGQIERLAGKSAAS
ncbi:MAG TPA: DinB family protein, partial [Candidatus Sulfopaludibacter sp.]|nr:DinB family protein [Candidatus Sulfopaludibacter sp.]